MVAEEKSSTPSKGAKKPLGGLVLHGFTSNFNCVDGVLPRLMQHEIPWRMPALRGHQSTPAALRGVVWRDWFDDGETALLELFNEVEQVIVISLSMGSLVGIELALRHPDKIAGLVCIAPALKAYGPNSTVASLIAKVMKNFKFKDEGDQWCDPKLYAERNKNYMEVPTSSIVEFLKFTEHTRQPERLQQIRMPLLVISTVRDKKVYHTEAQRLYDTASSQQKKIKFFEKSSHEMLLDCEAEQVLDLVEEFVVELSQKQQGQNQDTQAQASV
jgi:carboxylesterase